MDADAIHDLFRVFGPVSVRRMFGGAGIDARGVMFALVVDGTIYLKTGAGNAPDFEREGLEPFAYMAKNKKRSIASYRRMPDRLYDDPDELAEWARRALAMARSASRSHGSTRSVARRNA